MRDLGLNSFGERVIINDAGDLRVVDAKTGKSVLGLHAVKRKERTAVVKPKERAAVMLTNRPVSLTVTEQVAAELKKHPGVIASVDEATGQVTTLLVPTAHNADTQRLRERVNRLEVVRAQVEARGGLKTERSRVDEQLRKAKLDLDVVEKKLEYERERQRQGDMPAKRQEDRPRQARFGPMRSEVK